MKDKKLPTVSILFFVFTAFLALLSFYFYKESFSINESIISNTNEKIVFLDKIKKMVTDRNHLDKIEDDLSVDLDFQIDLSGLDELDDVLNLDDFAI